MANHRVERLGGEVRREVADILDHDIKDPRLGFVSVVSVDIAPDGCSAHIYVSPMAGGNPASEVEQALTSAGGYIRRELGKRLKTRMVPELYFHVDDSIAYGVRMSGVIDRQIAADDAAAQSRAPEDPDKYVE